MTPNQKQLIHATAVAKNGNGILITGTSGAGKSDLAIRLIDRGAILVSDDQVGLVRSDDGILLTPPSSIAGKIEIRELGIFELEYVQNIALKLVVELDTDTDRFPLGRQIRSFMGVKFPAIKMDSRLPSAPIKVEMMMQRLLQLENQP